MVRHKMSYIGHEPQRQTIKYRCPAMHEGWECPMAKICNAGKSYGLTVRVPQEIRAPPAGWSASLPLVAACDEEVRAPLQRPDIGGASERTVEDLLGSRRWELDGLTAFLCVAGRDHGGTRLVRDAAGDDPAPRRHAGPNEAQSDCSSITWESEGTRCPASPSPEQRTTIPPSIQRLTGPVPRPFADSLPPETDSSFFRWSYGSALLRVPRQSAHAHSLLRNTYPSGVPPAKPRQRNRLGRCRWPWRLDNAAPR